MALIATFRALSAEFKKKNREVPTVKTLLIFYCLILFRDFQPEDLVDIKYYSYVYDIVTVNMNLLSKPRNFHIIRWVLFFLIMSKATTQCPESNRTAKFVDSCPESAKKWAEAASRFNCQDIKNNCTSFVYHCVMNSNRTKMIEVCAPVTNILGSVCVEYNFLGGIIQRNGFAECKSCPEMYLSNDVYNYTECFKPKIPKTNQAAEFIELPGLNTKDKLTSSTQSNDSTKKTKSEKLINMNTTTDLTSFSQKNKINTNKIKQTDLPSVSFTSHSSSLHGSWAMSISRVALGVFASQLYLESPW